MPAACLSTLQRQQTFQRLTSTRYDLLVIGGGITGAGIALDAASRGLRVALVEMQDFAAGTSSRSTKLIHGGLRYLELLEFRHVRELGRERDVLHRNAPHLVRPLKMLLPITAKSKYGPLLTATGLWLYDRLAGVKPDDQFRMLSAADTIRQEPLLHPEGLRGSGLYTEYLTDDARLVLEVLKTAAAFGSDCLNYVAADGFVQENGRLTGARVTDVGSQAAGMVQARQIVNAAGAWSDAVRALESQESKPLLEHSKGVHLVVPHLRFPLRQAVYFFDARQERMVFAIPRAEVTYLGTTDTLYTEALLSPQVTAEEVTYLLAAVNKLFPEVRLTPADVTSSWAGIRPLVRQEGKSSYQTSRKEEIVRSPAGLISIAGGKLTGYRTMAEHVVGLVLRQLQIWPFPKSSTSAIPLAGGDYKNAADLAQAESQLQEEAALVKVAAAEAEKLFFRYGRNAAAILKKAAELQQAGQAQPLLRAEVWYGVTCEAVTTLSDFLTRRTGRLFFEREQIPAQLPVVTEELTKLLHWSAAQKEQESAQFRAEFEAAVAFRTTPS